MGVGSARGQEHPPAGATPRPCSRPLARAAPTQGIVACPQDVARGQQRLPQGPLPTPTACSVVAYKGQRWR
ncbi:hypothetical protein B296_00027340 [Ensete ventricosum]|uniref:Uncharacterized protein n=1 Tax=Ensete ventricosum TaxID=4639 RepID=A0A426YUQ6_ENSVE|nr:hypothetical protein B296_00027340 [Ensete ventricosum]